MISHQIFLGMISTQNAHTTRLPYFFDMNMLHHRRVQFQSTRHKQLKVGVVKIKDRIIHANPWLLGTVFYTINIPKDKLDALKPA